MNNKIEGWGWKEKILFAFAILLVAAIAFIVLLPSSALNSNNPEVVKKKWLSMSSTAKIVEFSEREAEKFGLDHCDKVDDMRSITTKEGIMAASEGMGFEDQVLPAAIVKVTGICLSKSQGYYQGVYSTFEGKNDFVYLVVAAYDKKSDLFKHVYMATTLDNIERPPGRDFDAYVAKYFRKN